jgi:hypothetical protein
MDISAIAEETIIKNGFYPKTLLIEIHNRKRENNTNSLVGIPEGPAKFQNQQYFLIVSRYQNKYNNQDCRFQSRKGLNQQIVLLELVKIQKIFDAKTLILIYLMLIEIEFSFFI